MRFRTWFLVVVAPVACSQPLAHPTTGTGGGGTGTGGSAGEPVPGTGGFGGMAGGGGSGVAGAGGVPSVEADCTSLMWQYQSGLTGAKNCRVGVPGDCQQLLPTNLSGCSCPTYVTDNSVLGAIQAAWTAGRCSTIRPCGVCPTLVGSSCYPLDGGTVGRCSDVAAAVGAGGGDGRNGTGGRGGTGGSSADGGIDLCSTLAAEYAGVLSGAKYCSPAPGSTDPCTQLVPSALTPCPGCSLEYVTDRSFLDVLRQKWEAGGCGSASSSCPPVSCGTHASAMCLPTDAGYTLCLPTQ
jgi:hypothetical protein